MRGCTPFRRAAGVTQSNHPAPPSTFPCSFAHSQGGKGDPNSGGESMLAGVWRSTLHRRQNQFIFHWCLKSVFGGVHLSPLVLASRQDGIARNNNSERQNHDKRSIIYGEDLKTSHNNTIPGCNRIRYLGLIANQVALQLWNMSLSHQYTGVRICQLNRNFCKNLAITKTEMLGFGLYSSSWFLR
jgi:hypothetical protein